MEEIDITIWFLFTRKKKRKGENVSGDFHDALKSFPKQTRSREKIFDEFLKDGKFSINVF